MSSTPESREKEALRKAADELSQGPSLVTLFEASILMLVSANTVFEALRNRQEQDLSDPVFGIAFRYLLLIFGLTSLFITLLCVLKHRDVLCFAVWWFSAIFGIYRIGLWTMGWPHPYPLLALLIEPFHVSPIVVDLLLTSIFAFLFSGSSINLWIGRQIKKSEEFHKMPCRSCGRDIRFRAQHIGEQIPCPHCQKAVTLLLANPGS